jgi:hypothetical protein
MGRPTGNTADTSSTEAFVGARDSCALALFTQDEVTYKVMLNCTMLHFGMQSGPQLGCRSWPLLRYAIQLAKMNG